MAMESSIKLGQGCCCSRRYFDPHRRPQPGAPCLGSEVLFSTAGSGGGGEGGGVFCCWMF